VIRVTRQTVKFPNQERSLLRYFSRLVIKSRSCSASGRSEIQIKLTLNPAYAELQSRL
jgi:hypothetical protein